MADYKGKKNEYIVENRDAEGFLKEMKKLAKSYTPEWNMDTNNPDVTTTLGILYADQLGDNALRMNQTIDKYHTAFINLLDITAKRAKAADGIITMGVAYDTIDGVQIPKGTKFSSEMDLGESEGSEDSFAEPVIFETQHDVYITGSSIATIFATDLEDGSITQVLGTIEAPSILNKVTVQSEESEEPDTEEEIIEKEAIDAIPEDDPEVAPVESQRIQPFTLFTTGHSVAQNVCMLYHSIIFNTIENAIFIKIDGCKSLIEAIESGEIQFRYPVNNELVCVEAVELLDDGQTYKLKKDKQADLQQIGTREYASIALYSEHPITDEYLVKAITISSSSEFRNADYVGDGNQDFTVDRFLPFRDEIRYMDECYIGADEIFSKAGATVYIQFKLEIEENMLRLTAEQQAADLKVIRRKPKDDANMNPAEVFADQVTFEYFNGIGWKRLPLAEDHSQLFAQAGSKMVSLNFTCPRDWKSSVAGSFEGRMIRITVTKADNCYMRPAIHHYPKITGLLIKYDYDDKYEVPEQINVFSGVSKNTYTAAAKAGEPYPVLSPTGFNHDALYIGLDEKPLSGPVGIMFKLNELLRYERLPIIFEYSTRNGFNRLKVLDETDYLSHSGVIYFIPPADFAATTLAGNRNFWIRILRKNVQKDMEQLPEIEDIIINAVRISNKDTQDEQDFFITEITPNISFELGFDDILEADVWVNEMTQLSMKQMLDMLTHEPQRCFAEYDFEGNISNFFVKWEEVDNLSSASHKRVYIIDRLENKLVFGDGINTEIPRNLQDVALKVTCTLCKGVQGNIPMNSITSPTRNILYVGAITNPVKTYGGSAMETLNEALVRGENIIATRNRLVSKKDYISEIIHYSDVIDQAELVTNIRPDNTFDEGAITACVLMKDYEEGAFSFHQIQNNLKNYLLSRSEMTINPDDFYITEPIFVELSVTVWANSIKHEENFYLQNALHEILDSYFNPLKSTGGMFKIGTMPTVEQIRMRLNPLKNKMVIDNISVLANYKDETGIHEISLDELELKPFMIVRNGKHQIR